MEKLSIKKLSILGLVLMVASAVTAAILPSKNKTTVDKAGALQPSSNGGVTCVTAAEPDGCNVSATTDTSTVDNNDPDSTSDDVSLAGSTSVDANTTM